jgi:hypothetical protein
MDLGSRDFGEIEQRQSPVDVAVRIREELADFHRNSSKEALREAMLEACKAALLQVTGRPDRGPVVDYLKRQGLIRASKRGLANNLSRAALRLSQAKG